MPRHLTLYYTMGARNTTPTAGRSYVQPKPHSVSKRTATSPAPVTLPVLLHRLFGKMSLEAWLPHNTPPSAERHPTASKLKRAVRVHMY
ncbi:hypothetical protein FKM82_027383 [Ascaphus truei]